MSFDQLLSAAVSNRWEVLAVIFGIISVYLNAAVRGVVIIIVAFLQRGRR